MFLKNISFYLLLCTVFFRMPATAMPLRVQVSFQKSATTLDSTPASEKNVTVTNATETLATVLDDPRIKNPSVIIWYGGKNGISNRSYDFYDKCVVGPLKAAGAPFKLYGYDLSAWQGLNDPAISLTEQYARFVAARDERGRTSIIPLYASEYFFFLAYGLGSRQLSYLVETVLARTFLAEISRRYARASRYTFADLGYVPQLIEALVAKKPPLTNTALAYSTLQYLEGLWLVREVVLRALRDDNNDQTIIFLLPQGELEYFYDQSTGITDSSFQEDVNAFLANDPTISTWLSKLPDALNIRIIFADFTYRYTLKKGKSCDRPYINMPWDKIL